jgi:hypothetical protein
VLLVLAIVLGFVMVLAGAVGVVVYDRATAIDRSTPVVSGDAFLHAALVEGTVARVGLFTCQRWSAQDALAAVTALTDPEAKSSWDTFDVLSQSGGSAVLRARVRFQYPGEVAPSGEAFWRLDLVDENGWRVCAVARDG